MRNISRKSYRENQNTHFLFSNFFQKPCRLWDNMEEFGRARQAIDTVQALCMRDNYGKNKRARACARAHKHTHKHTHRAVVTQMCLNVTFICTLLILFYLNFVEEPRVTELMYWGDSSWWRQYFCLPCGIHTGCGVVLVFYPSGTCGSLSSDKATKTRSIPAPFIWHWC
jgi:hypothetical protein